VEGLWKSGGGLIVARGFAQKVKREEGNRPRTDADLADFR
jgi:hypothetical protein